MSLNPVQFGTEVIDQFGRYLMTTFPIADPAMESQVASHLRHDIGGERLIAKGPYVYLNRPFEQGPSLAGLCAELGLALHPGLKAVFPFESIHKHQHRIPAGCGTRCSIQRLCAFVLAAENWVSLIKNI